jgi:hypothetical protein
MKFVVKSMLKEMYEEVKKFPHIALTATLFCFACLWWTIQKQATAKRILEVRGEQIALEKEYYKAVKVVGNLRDDEREKLTAHYQKEIKKLDEIDEKIDKAVSRGPAGIASEWAEYLGAKKR